MFSQIKDNRKIVVDDSFSVEKHLSIVLKEFNFKEVPNTTSKLFDQCTDWSLGDFFIQLRFTSEHHVPRIFLYYKEEQIIRYDTFSHRMWWYARIEDDYVLDSSKSPKRFDSDSAVINDLMENLRKKWSKKC